MGEDILSDDYFLLSCALATFGQSKAKHRTFLVESDLAHFQMIRLTTAQHACRGSTQAAVLPRMAS